MPTIEFHKTPFRHPYIGWVYRSLPDDPTITGFVARVRRWQLWVEWRR